MNELPTSEGGEKSDPSQPPDEPSIHRFEVTLPEGGDASCATQQQSESATISAKPETTVSVSSAVASESSANVQPERAAETAYQSLRDKYRIETIRHCGNVIWNKLNEALAFPGSKQQIKDARAIADIIVHADNSELPVEGNLLSENAALRERVDRLEGQREIEARQKEAALKESSH